MKKILAEVGTLIGSGLVCILLSYGVISKFMVPEVELPKADAHAEGKEGGAAEEKKEGHGAEAEAGEHGEKAEGGHGEAKAEGGEHGAAPAKAAPAEPDGPGLHGNTYTMKPVIVNLAGDGARRYAKATVNLVLKDEKSGDQIVKNEPQAYDMLIKTLNRYRYDELNSPEGKESLKEEIKTRFNMLLPKSGIENVYLTELIIQ